MQNSNIIYSHDEQKKTLIKHQIDASKIMEKEKLYSKKMQIFVRIISLIAMIILIISNIQRIVSLGTEQLITNKCEFYTFLMNCISILLFLVVILFPIRMEILSFLSFIYGAVILITEPGNDMGILMFWLYIVILHARGFFNQKKKLKETIATIVYCALILSEIRFGADAFLRNLLEKIAYTFIYFMSLLFFQIYITNKLDILENNKKLDLQKYPELRKRDAEWLRYILNGEKYDFLANAYKMSIGSVKNRIKVIYEVLEVGDRQGFINKYSDFQICYGDDFSSL